MTTTVLMLALAAFAGVAFGLQGPVNAGLARHVGGPFAASLVSFAVGVVTMAIAWGVAVAAGAGSNLRGIAAAPPVLLIGGLLGAIGVCGMTIVVPRVGVALAMGTLIFGQMACALAADHFGWFGAEPIPVSARRLAGGAVLLVGVWLLRR
jgi:transporter family-2 protein